MFKFKTYVILSYQEVMHIFVLEIIGEITWFLGTKNKNFNFIMFYTMLTNNRNRSIKIIM